MRQAFLPPMLVLAALGVAIPGQAQTEPLQPVLDVEMAFLSGEAADGIYPGYQGTLEVPWTLTFADPATAAAELSGEPHAITWTLACPEPLAIPPSSTPIEFVPAQVEYAGTALLTVQADPAARGVSDIPCQVTGAFAGNSMQAQDTVEATLVVTYHGALNVTAPVTDRMGAPQKQIRYELTITNQGNARTVVTFEAAALPGKWQLLLPDPVLLEPGETRTAFVSVATPFDNGYNKGGTDVTIVMTPMSADDPEQVGPATSVELHATVNGLYVPGPPLALLVVALAVASAWHGRRS